jgi:hypothetical protein
MLVVSGQLLRQQTGPELDRILINDLFAATGIVSPTSVRFTAAASVVGAESEIAHDMGMER